MKLVIGGGISGLSAAHYLIKQFPASEIILTEASNRFGGWIHSIQSQNGNVIFEKGPHTIRPTGLNGINTLEILDELGLASKVSPVQSTSEAAKNRMIYVNGKLHTLPSSFLKACTRQDPFNRSLLASVLSDLWAKPKQVTDEPIYDFVARRFGKDVAEYAISPLICGICAGDAKEISVNFLMQHFFELEQKHGGIIKGLLKTILKKKEVPKATSELAKRAKAERWSVYTMDGGMELIPRTLKDNLEKKNVKILANSPCRNLEFYHKNVFVSLENENIVTNHVISSLIAKDTAKLVEKQHPKLSVLLNQIPTVNVAVVNLQYNQRLAIKNAFGFLVPPSQNLPILGVIFDHCFTDVENQTVLTVMLGGRFFYKYFGDDTTEEQFYDVAVKHVEDILKIEAKPDSKSVSVLRDCIPQYTVGHNERVKLINNYIESHKLPLSLCGSSYYGVGINDVILSAKRAAINAV